MKKVINFGLGTASMVLWTLNLKFLSIAPALLTVSPKLWINIVAGVTTLIYFLSTLTLNTWDLKILLFSFSLLMLSNLRPPKARSSVGPWDMLAYCVIGTVLINLITGTGIGINTVFIDEGDRERAYFLWEVAYLLIFIIQGRTRRFAYGCALATVGFVVSGDRGAATLCLAISLISSLFRKPKYSLVILFLCYLGSYALIGLVYPFGSFLVKHQTFLYALQNFSFLPAGITPPLNSDLYESLTETFFVPADVGVVGILYELGLFLFLIKAIFAIISWRKVREYPQLVLIWCLLVFSYGMTADFFEILLLYFLARQSRFRFSINQG